MVQLIVDILPDNSRTEYDSNDVRYTCYSLLQGISFNGEPVVPKIVQGQEVIEHEGKTLGKSFKVENLPGVDLSVFVTDKNISLRDKFLVLKHIVGQLSAIDEAGYVLFDRHGDNIRVLRYGEDGISTRQVDVEEVYIKSENKMIANDSKESREKAIATFREKGINVWFTAIWRVAVEGCIAADVGERADIKEKLEKFTLKSKEGIRERTLQNLEKAFDDAAKGVK